MDALREYLNNLFLGLPETPEVLRAKAELLENMEDKYEELIREGKTEQEAIGIVISEFGDLQELAGELGIAEYMKNIRGNADGKFASRGTQGMNESKQSAGGNSKNVEKVFRWGFDETKKYISYAWTHALLIAAAVFLCIFAPFIITVFEACGASGYVSYMISEVIGVSLFFLFIAVAVVLFLLAYEMKKRYGTISQCGIMLDAAAGEYAVQKYQKETRLRLIMRFCGIFLCIVSVVPSSVNYFSDLLVREIMDSSVLFIAGLGVFLIVMSASAGNRYDELQKAVNNAAGYGRTGNRESSQGSGMIWNTPEGDGAYAGWEQTGKKKMSSMAVVLLIIIGMFVAGGIVLSNVVYVSWHNKNTSAVGEVSEYAFDKIGKVVADLDFTELTVIRSQTPDDAGIIRVEYNGSSLYRPNVTFSKETLQISEKSDYGRWFSFDIGWFTRPAEHKSSMVVVLPYSSVTKDYDMDISVDAGSITCSGIQATNLKIDVDAGNALLQNCIVKEKAAVDVDAGEIDIEQSAIGFLQGDVDAGSVTCSLTDRMFEAYNMELDTDLGNINIRDENKGGSYSQTAMAGADAVNGGFGRMEIEVDMGDITMHVLPGQ